MKIEEIIQNKLREVFHDNSIIFDKSRFTGGLTNYNYIMEIHGKSYVVRQPGGMTELMIDRKIEKINNCIASELGINSECVFFDEEYGIKISLYIEHSKNIALSDPCAPANLRAVSNLLKKLHYGKRAFSNQFDFQAELKKYEEIVKNLNGEFFLDYSSLKSQLMEFLEKRVINLISLPCHNDTVPENFIVDESGRTYLIDWEYAGMNDPSWDIAAYILESRLTKSAIDMLLNEYYGQYPSPGEILKIKGFMLAQDLLWTVWALIRHYNGDDFLDYCYLRYERFRKNMKNITTSLDYPLEEMVK